MTSEKPVVAVGEGGLKETITDGQTGILTARDPATFGAAVARLINDRKLARTIGHNGRADVETRWHWSKTATEIDRLLHEVTRK